MRRWLPFRLLYLTYNQVFLREISSRLQEPASNPPSRVHRQKRYRPRGVAVLRKKVVAGLFKSNRVSHHLPPSRPKRRLRHFVSHIPPDPDTPPSCCFFLEEGVGGGQTGCWLPVTFPRTSTPASKSTKTRLARILFLFVSTPFHVRIPPLGIRASCSALLIHFAKTDPSLPITISYPKVEGYMRIKLCVPEGCHEGFFLFPTNLLFLPVVVLSCSRSCPTVCFPCVLPHRASGKKSRRFGKYPLPSPSPGKVPEYWCTGRLPRCFFSREFVHQFPFSSAMEITPPHPGRFQSRKIAQPLYAVLFLL